MSERLTELSAEDRDRAEAVLVAHSRFIEAVAMRYAPSFDAVPDIVQEVGIRVCQSLHTFRGDSNIKTWLFTITRNRAVSHFRGEARHERTADQVAQQPDVIVDIEDTVIEDDLEARRRGLVREIIDGAPLLRPDGTEILTSRQRLALRHLTQPRRVLLDGSEKSTLWRARQRIRQWIHDHHPELTEPDE